MPMTTREVVEITGVKHERLRAWIKDGFIIPDLIAKQGRTHVFRDGTLYKIFLFKKLVDFGLNRKIAYLILSRCEIETNKNTYLIVYGNTTPKSEKNWGKQIKFTNKITDFLTGAVSGEFLFVVNLHAILQEALGKALHYDNYDRKTPYIPPQKKGENNGN